MTTPPEVVAAFTEGAITALRELIALEAWPASEMANASGPSMICAQIDLLREAPGRMALVLTESTAAKLAERFLPASATLSDEIVNDVSGEFANVIAGQAKTLLKGTPHHFLLSTPKVERFEYAPATEKFCAITLSTELGDVTISVD